MRITPLDLLNIQGDLADTRNDSRYVYGLVPVTVRQDFSVDDQSANDMTEGNGLGQIVPQWRIYALRIHFRSIDSVLMTYGHVPPGVVLGDLLVNFGPRDLDVMNQLYATPDAYLFIDGDTYDIISITGDGLGAINEYDADARAFSPNYRAPGY